MTLKEAKKLLKKEFMVIGIHKTTEPFEFDESGWFEHEKPAVLEAFRVLAKEGYYISISGHDYNEREKRLKKEYEENTKSPGPGEEQPEEKKGIIYPTTFPKADFYHKHVLNEGNPALKEAASQFNDALLDEQAKKIEELTKDKELMKKATLSQLDDFIEIYNLLTKESQKTKRLGKEIARLNSIIHEKNEELKRKTKGCCELVTENVDLEKKLSDKDAVLSDIAEEIRLSKIREKNLTEVCQKYMKENEELREKIAEKAKLVKMIRNASKEYCDYGVAANEFIKELAGLYILANNTRIINDEMLERCKNYQTYGFPANCNRETKKEINDIASGKTKAVGVDIAEEGGDHSAIIARCFKNIAISKDEAEIIERCTKNGTELHYSEKDGFTYTNVYGDEIPIIYLRGMFQAFTDEEIKNMKK